MAENQEPNFQILQSEGDLDGHINHQNDLTASPLRIQIQSKQNLSANESNKDGRSDDFKHQTPPNQFDGFEENIDSKNGEQNEEKNQQWQNEQYQNQQYQNQQNQQESQHKYDHFEENNEDAQGQNYQHQGQVYQNRDQQVGYNEAQQGQAQEQNEEQFKDYDQQGELNGQNQQNGQSGQYQDNQEGEEYLNNYQNQNEENQYGQQYQNQEHETQKQFEQNGQPNEQQQAQQHKQNDQKSFQEQEVHLVGQSHTKQQYQAGSYHHQGGYEEQKLQNQEVFIQKKEVNDCQKMIDLDQKVENNIQNTQKSEQDVKQHFNITHKIEQANDIKKDKEVNDQILQKKVSEQTNIIKDQPEKKIQAANQSQIKSNKINQQSNESNAKLEKKKKKKKNVDKVNENINPDKKQDTKKQQLVQQNQKKVGDPPVSEVPPQKINSSDQSPILPLPSNLDILLQAEKQRIGTTYNLFRKYNFQHQKTTNSYKLVIKNVFFEIERRKKQKVLLQETLKTYFQSYAKMGREFYEKCYKIQRQQKSFETNKYANIREELKKGCQELIYLRKSVANDCHKMDNFSTNHIIKNLTKIFSEYYSAISAEQMRQNQRKQQHQSKQKHFKKVISKLDKVFKKGIEGKLTEDLFVEVSKFVNEQKTYRDSLCYWGKGLIDLRKTFIRTQKQLMDKLQNLLNEFKTESRTVYCVGKRSFTLIQDFSQSIKQQATFEKLCTLTDIDYIKYVLELQNKRQNSQFTNKHFVQYLNLVFFEKVVGYSKDLLKGTINKIFFLHSQSQQLVHTISSNLVHFDKINEQIKNKFVIKNLNAKIISEGVVQFDEVLKGIIFDDNRTVRIKFRDYDRAEELICYLNEKDNVISK